MLVILMCPVNSFAEGNLEFAGGDGTAENPYLIATKEQLNSVRNHLSSNFKMTADIVFTAADFTDGGEFYNGGAGWDPIGTSLDNMISSSDPVFRGTFDGNNHTISGLYVNLSSQSY
jgi:hypothetical protein